MSRSAAATLVGVLLSLALAAPAGAAATTDTLTAVDSVVAVARGDDFPVGSIMRADCAFVRRTQRPDGSAVESMRCDLSDVPVMVPAFQGVAPDSAFVDTGGPCIWTSDYWHATSDITVYASSYRLVVAPSGEVHATSTYPTVPLSCE